MNDFHFSGVPNAFGSGRDPQEQEPTRSRRRRGRKASAVPGFGSGSSGSSGAPQASGGSGFGSGAQGSGPSGARGSAGFGSGSSGSSGSPGAWGSAGFGSGAPQASGAPGPSGFSEPSGPAGAPGFGTASPGTSAPASPGGLTTFFRSFRASRTSGQAADGTGGQAADGTSDQAADSAGSPVRSSRTTRPAVVLCVLGLAGIAWGSYHFLASIDVFGVVFSGASLIHLTDVLLATLSALLVLLALLLSVRGMVVSRPRRVPVVVFVAALLLPLPVAVGSLLLGAEALKDNVVDDAWDYVGRVSPQDVDTVYDQLEGYGIRIPGREEVHRILTTMTS